MDDATNATIVLLLVCSNCVCASVDDGGLTVPLWYVLSYEFSEFFYEALFFLPLSSICCVCPHDLLKIQTHSSICRAHYQPCL